MVSLIGRRVKHFVRDYPKLYNFLIGATVVAGEVTTAYFCFKAVSSSVGCINSISGKSMQPTLNPSLVCKVEEMTLRQKWIESDWVWVNCWRAMKHKVDRGNLIVYVSPKNPEELLIKRVIATEGDIVETNGSGDYPLPRVRIPSGHVWVQGDNRAVSVDSNKYGPVSLGLMVGVATHILWPLSRASRISSDTETYKYFHNETKVTKVEDLDPENVTITTRNDWPYCLKVMKNFFSH